MDRKYINKVLISVSLLLLPLVMQTLHVLHVNTQDNHAIHCHHHHDDGESQTEHEHEECLICDFEFNLFHDEIFFIPLGNKLILTEYLTCVSGKSVVKEQLRLNPLRGPPPLT
jgi:hypothetical protein